MRRAIGFVVVLLLVTAGEVRAAGNQPSCLEGLWVPTGNMTAPRALHAATLLPDGKVLVAGGATGIATAELYDPSTGTWSLTGSMSIPRQAHTMTLLPTGEVLAAGGSNTSGLGTRPAELYDPATGRWTTTGAMLDDRELHTATLLPSGKVLVVGGYGAPGPMANVELYDPATGEWHATGPLSTARFLHTATLLASGEVLVLGGIGGIQLIGGPTNSAELYDPTTETWKPAAPMMVARFQHTATLVRSHSILVAGGRASTEGPDSSGVPTEAELYDLASGTWRRTGSLHAPHAQHTATELSSGRILVVGVPEGIEPMLRNTELFDPESESWSDAGCTVEARAGHTATLLLSGAVLVAGGPDSSAELYGIFVSPAQVSLTPGATQTFTARGGSGFDYVWSFLQNNSGGTLTASGVYQAGPVGGVTDIVQVVDSFANSATATVNVTKQASALSPTSSQANSMGCGTTGGTALPSLAGAVLVLLGWRVLRGRRPRRTRVGTLTSHNPSLYAGDDMPRPPPARKKPAGPSPEVQAAMGKYGG